MTTRISRKHGIGLFPLICGLLVLFIFLGLLGIDLYRIAIYSRRLNNYTQIIAQYVASRVNIGDRLNDEIAQTTYFIDRQKAQAICNEAVERLIRPSIASRRTTWDNPPIYRFNSPHLRCKVTESNVLEIIAKERFLNYSPFFNNYELFAYTRTRLWAGILTPARY